MERVKEKLKQELIDLLDILQNLSTGLMLILAPIVIVFCIIFSIFYTSKGGNVHITSNVFTFVIGFLAVNTYVAFIGLIKTMQNRKLIEYVIQSQTNHHIDQSTFDKENNRMLREILKNMKNS